MPDSVIDASALAALAFTEARADEARRAVAGQTLHAPLLLAYELTHVAQKKALADPAQAPQFLSMLANALNADIRWVDVDHLRTFELANATGLSSYDAAYVRLARALSIPLITFDRRMRAVMDRLTQSDALPC